jgi:2-octaprenylphenol hydroxylase
MAGQGLNIGLADAGAIAELLDATPLPSGNALEQRLMQYHRWRHSAGTLLAGAIHGFNELNRLPLGLGRQAMAASMMTGQWLWPVREVMVRRACGIDGDSPKIARQPQSTPAAAASIA